MGDPLLRRAFVSGVVLPVLALAGCQGSGDTANGESEGAPEVGAPSARAAVLTWGDEALVSDPSKRGNRTEIDVAIDPLDPSNVLAIAIDWDFPGGFAAKIFRSADGGKSWADRGYVPHPKPPIQGACTPRVSADPVIHFDDRGIAYAGYIAYACVDEGTESGSLYLLRSEDGGENWEGPFLVHNEHAVYADGSCYGLDKEWITTDPVTGSIHFVWMDFIFRACDLSSRGMPIVHRSSDDGGRTWGPISVVSDPAEYTQGPEPVFLPDGAIVVTYIESIPRAAPRARLCPPDPLRVLTAFEESDPLRPSRIISAQSTDGGTTWSQTVVAEICSFSLLEATHPLAINEALTLPRSVYDDVNGAIVLTWSERDYPEPLLHVARSVDGGLSWTATTLPDEPGHAAFLPAVAADRGIAHVLYMSTTNAGTYDMLHRSSTNGGLTWSTATRLNDGVLCLCLGLQNTFGREGGLPPYPNVGHYLGLDARAGLVVPIWPALTQPQGVQDLIARPARAG